ncbi:MAG: hypothetical protein HY820_39865 [Acidobacteria bacterium]|nr:hypothetical protein [Acidobacteriota bacterium]
MRSLRIIFAAGVFLLSATGARAQLVATGQTLTVTTTNAVATFQGADLTGFRNRGTNENYLRLPTSAPGLATVQTLASTGQLTLSGWTVSGDTATITASDAVRTLTLTVKIDPASQEIVIRSAARISSTGLRQASWSIAGLDISNGHLIVPSNTGQVFDAAHPGLSAFLQYPNTWQAQMFVYETAQGTMLAYSTDQEYAFKRLNLNTRGGSTLDLGIATEANGPMPAASAVPTVEWRLKAFTGDWRTAAQVYKSWLAANRPPVSNAAHPWVQNLRGIVGMGNSDASLLAPLAAKLTPGTTLLYLINWRSNAYDVNYPDYTPAAGVASFVSQAHALGFKVMLHTDLPGVSPGNADYAGLQAYQVKTPDTLEPMGWFWDRPASTPGRFAYISPASSQFRSLWISRVRAAVTAVQPDALHLDISAPMYNDGNGLIGGLSYAQGSAQLHRDIIAAFPNLALGGEGMNDILYGFNSVAQAWSVATDPVDSLGHPIAAFLFTPQVMYYGHLVQPKATDRQFKAHLQTLERRGVLPRVHVDSAGDLDTTNSDNARLLNIFNNWAVNSFQLAANSDWTGALVRYQGAGNTTASLTDSSQILTLTGAGTTLFQLAHDVNQLASTQLIPGWAAFDNTTFYGLDSTKQYWLAPGARPANMTHATSIPSGVKLGAGTLVGDGFAHFEVESAAPPLFDFMANLLQSQQGVTYQGVDGPIAFGAVVTPSFNTAGGVGRSNLFLHPPYQGQLGGETYIQFSAPVPANASFTFSIGVDDGAACTDGVTFRVTVNGVEAWRLNAGRTGWHDGSVDLATYAGSTVSLRLISNPGPQSNAGCDWSAWSQLQIVTQPRVQTITVPLALAPGSPGVFTGDGSYTAASSTSATIGNVPVPGQFTVFTQTGQAVAAGMNIAALPFQVWSGATGDYLQLGSLPGNGDRATVTSGGVAKTQAIFAHPPNGGRTILSWMLNLPASGGLTLNWSAGIGDGADSDDGVQFSVLVTDSLTGHFSQRRMVGTQAV